MKTTSLRVALSPLSSSIKGKVRELYFSKGGDFGNLNTERRKLLEAACFEVQNELEHRQHTHAQVERLNAVRNLLLDDAYENESVPGLRYSRVEAAAALLPKKREMSDERRAELVDRMRKLHERNGGLGGISNS